MSIASELEALRTNINLAYGSVQAKGGDVPASKNMENLSSAISTIKKAPIALDFTSGYAPMKIALMQAHYDNVVNIHDYWSVGDKITLHLPENNMPQYGTLPEQDVTIQIVDLDYYGSDKHTFVWMTNPLPVPKFQMFYSRPTNAPTGARYGESLVRDICRTYGTLIKEFLPVKEVTIPDNYGSYTITGDYGYLPSTEEVNPSTGFRFFREKGSAAMGDGYWTRTMSIDTNSEYYWYINENGTSNSVSGYYYYPGYRILVCGWM